MLKIKRVYEKPEKGDGERILIDRMWPRGLTKEKVQAKLWLRDIAPSTELRKWFGHDPEKWKDFRKMYFKELDGKKELVGPIAEKAKKKIVTLIYGAKDEKHNNAEAIKEYIETKD